MDRSKHEGGYAGIIALLLSALIVALIFTKLYLTRNVDSTEMSSLQPATASGTVPSTELERMRADVDAASALKAKLDAENRATDAAIFE